MIKRRAIENQALAIEEFEKAKKIKIEAKAASQRTKAKIKLIEKEQDLAEKRKKLVQVSKKLVTMKTSYKQNNLWDELDHEIQKEQKIIDYNKNLATNKNELININKNIAIIEEDIIKDRMLLARKTQNLGKVYKNLGKKQEKYANLASTNVSPEKLNAVQKEYKNERIRLNNKREKIEQVLNQIQQKQNKKSALNTELSQKVAQRAKLKLVQI